MSYKNKFATLRLKFCKKVVLTAKKYSREIFFPPLFIRATVLPYKASQKNQLTLCTAWIIMVARLEERKNLFNPSIRLRQLTDDGLRTRGTSLKTFEDFVFADLFVIK